MSFLQRIKSKNIRSGNTISLSKDKQTEANTVAQLHVDVHQSEQMTVIYAQCAGADMSDVHISIEGEGNIILIEGKRVRPEYIVFKKKTHSGSFVVEECKWGEFYRRIILPDSVDTQKAEAKIKNGVLILVLPTLEKTEEDVTQRAVSKGASHKTKL